MGRLPRFIPENKDSVLVEVTCRVIGARALLTPSPNPPIFNEVVVGVMGRALEVSPIELCGCVVLSNHLHLLAVVHEQQELSRFMAHFACNLSKEIGHRMERWRGSFWERRYDGIVVSDEPEKQWDRLKYLLSHGVKEELVERPTDWPGVHCARALMEGTKLVGYWRHRTKECAARHRGEEYMVSDFLTRYLVGFAPLPAFRDLSPEEYRERIRDLALEIEEECAEKRGDNPVAGIEKILAQNPQEPPTRQTKRGPKPAVHAATPEAKKLLLDERWAYLGQYRSAAEELRGDLGRRAASNFPHGCYPPRLPFTGAPAPACPPSPPTRRITVLASGEVVRGPIPTVEPPVRLWGIVAPESSMGEGKEVEPQARGQPL